MKQRSFFLKIDLRKAFNNAGKIVAACIKMYGLGFNGYG